MNLSRREWLIEAGVFAMNAPAFACPSPKVRICRKHWISRLAPNIVGEVMSGLIACISAFFSAFSRHRDLALENLALRQQLAIFKRRHPRPSLRPTDRLFWVWLSKIWTGWREALIIVKPETVIAWHRQAFRFYWRWLSRRKSIGRPRVSAEVRNVDQTDDAGQSAVGSASHPR